MTADKVTELRRRLAASKDLSEIFHYFCDHFADHPSFWDLGRDNSETGYTKILAHLAGDRLGTDVIEIAMVFQREIPEIKMLHGFYRVNGRYSQLFYFTDLDYGMACICEFSGLTHFARINSIPVGNAATKSWAAARQ